MSAKENASFVIGVPHIWHTHLPCSLDFKHYLEVTPNGLSLPHVQYDPHEIQI